MFYLPSLNTLYNGMLTATLANTNANILVSNILNSSKTAVKWNFLDGGDGKVIRGQSSELGEQRTEGGRRGRRSEVRDQRTNDRGKILPH
jgi:hypothetical protein